jgi:hypothetical protein
VRALLTAAVLLALAALALPAGAWLALGAALVLGCLAALAGARRRAAKRLWLAAAAALLALALVEAAALAGRLAAGAPRTEGDYASAAYWNDDDPDLGYAPQPGARVRSRAWSGARQLYDVVYTIDERGLRRAGPAPAPGAAEGCVLFFGCSITFGEGLDDEATLPWLAAERAGGRWRAVNFAFHGYGPHQALAAFDAGRVRTATAGCAGRAVAVFQYGSEHARRARAPSSWDRDGPRYLVDRARGVVRAGSFDPAGAPPAGPGRFRPEAVRWFEGRWAPALAAAERRFFVALLLGARERFARDFPGGEAHLVLLDPRPDPATVAALEAGGVRVHPIRSILPDWRPRAPRWSIPGDFHPNRSYNEALAAWLVDNVLRARRRER